MRPPVWVRAARDFPRATLAAGATAVLGREIVARVDGIPTVPGAASALSTGSAATLDVTLTCLSGAIFCCSGLAGLTATCFCSGFLGCETGIGAGACGADDRPGE